LLFDLELSCGTIDYLDTGGDGPVVVLLHGLAMDHTLWGDVIEDLARDHRCIAPTLPSGAHRHPVKPAFRLNATSVASLIGELLEALDLRDVVLVENDSGRAQTYAAGNPARVRRLVIVACEAFENYPPGFAGKLVGLVARIPGGIRFVSLLVRVRALRHLPTFFGQMSNRRIPDSVTDSWMASLIGDARVRRDFERYCRSVEPDEMMRAAQGLADFERPALIVWAADDRLMPAEHGERFVRTMPNARLVVIEDSGTLVPIDQPARLAAEIRAFSTP
jgi:pimeloyl-ACP methyl ester carboxylesterase